MQVLFANPTVKVSKVFGARSKLGEELRKAQKMTAKAVEKSDRNVRAEAAVTNYEDCL